jgi:RNA polymerase sigma-70 factor, ECF subfamily
VANVSFPAESSRLEHVQENFVRHILPLRGFIFGLVPRRHLVDDIVQETFVTACQKAETYEPGSNFKAWIFAIARFKALATVKRQTGRVVLLEPEVVELLASEVRPDHGLQDRVAVLDGCIGKLADTARRAVVLRYSESLGPTEIAQRMGWSVNALNVALTRARIFLRRCVEESIRPSKPC